MSNFEMDWNSIPDSNSQDKVDFYKIEPGSNNRFRIAGKPGVIDIHWEKSIDGMNKKILCSGPECPICKMNKAPQTRYQVLVIDRKDNKIKVLEGGPTIFNQIKNYAKEEDYGDPTKYDFKINKEGTGRETKYTLMPSPKKSDYTDEEKELIANSKPLSEINKFKTKEEIDAMHLEIFANSIVNNNIDDDFVTTMDDNDEWGDI